MTLEESFAQALEEEDFDRLAELARAATEDELGIFVVHLDRPRVLDTLLGAREDLPCHVLVECLSHAASPTDVEIIDRLREVISPDTREYRRMVEYVAGRGTLRGILHLQETFPGALDPEHLSAFLLRRVENKDFGEAISFCEAIDLRRLPGRDLCNIRDMIQLDSVPEDVRDAVADLKNVRLECKSLTCDA